MIKEQIQQSLWLDVDDYPLTDGYNHSPKTGFSENGSRLSSIDRSAKLMDENLETLLDEAYELGARLECEGLAAEATSQEVMNFLQEHAPGLKIDSGAGPYDVSVGRGAGWGTVVYFDSHNRRGSLGISDDYDQESWGLDDSSSGDQGTGDEHRFF